jgi:hypothetical protein
MRTAPDELTTALLLMPGKGEWPAGVSVFVCYAGHLDDADTAIAPLLDIGSVVSNEVKDKPHVDVLEDPHPPPGVLPVVSNTLVPRIDASTVAAISDAYQGGGSGRVIFLRSLGGAMSRVPADSTAFGHRDIEAMVVTAAFLPLDASPEMIAEASEPAEALAAHGVGAYAGFLGSESPNDVERMYPAEALTRLTEVKRAYDPDNVFRHNFNIAPH